MKKLVKVLANKYMQHLFGYTPYPPVKSTPLEFKRIDVPEREYTCEEFNEISMNLFRLKYARN